MRLSAPSAKIDRFIGDWRESDDRLAPQGAVDEMVSDGTTISDNHEQDYRRVADGAERVETLAGTNIEIVRRSRTGEASGTRTGKPHAAPRHVLFDFDGTLSLVREGWPDVMVPLMVEVLQATGTGEPVAQLRSLCADFVAQLTGKQTIYQMIRLAEEVGRRGGKPEDPVVYKGWYLDRLGQRIAGRREGLRSGRIAPREMVVPHSLELLDALRGAGRHALRGQRDGRAVRARGGGAAGARAGTSAGTSTAPATTTTRFRRPR